MTLEERQGVYARVTPEIKAPVLTLLTELLEPMAAQIRSDFAANPENWWKRGYFHFGLAIRNQLLRRGYDANYFGVGNLDDIYIFLVKEALELR